MIIWDHSVSTLPLLNRPCFCMIGVLQQFVLTLRVFIQHKKCLLASVCPSLHAFCSNVSPFPLIMSAVSSFCSSFLFLSFHHLHCFSVVPFFPFASLPLPFPAILSPPHRSATRPLCCIPPFILPSTLNPGTLLLSFPPPLFFFFLLPSIHPFIYPLPFCGCIAGGGVADACLPGFWGAAGVCNDHGKTYALYAITVIRRNQDGSEDCWKTYRRYSDFHDFHMRITEQVRVSSCVTRQNPTNGSKRGSITGDLSGFLAQFENLASILKLPGKKTFNNMDRDFLEKRKKDLNAYLQVRL